MTIEIDVSGDFEVVDGLKLVTYSSRIADDEYAAGFAVTGCFMEPISKAELMMAGGQFADCTSFLHIWSDNLPNGFVPKVGDRWQMPDGALYQVRQVTLETMQTRWRLAGVLERY